MDWNIQSTLNKTIGLFEGHILPELGRLYIDMIKVTHCQEALNGWFKKLKNFRIMNTYTGMVFKYAIKLGFIRDNPTQLVTMPTRRDQVEEEKAENFYTKEELTAFLIVVKEQEAEKWPMLFRVLAYTGARKGEVLALQWGDLNFKDSTITINKTLSLGLANQLIIQTPKTKKSKRILPMDPGTMAALKEWKALQAKELLMLGFNALGKNQLVFSNSKNSYICPQKIGQKINAVCRRNDLRPITTHGFRHTHCSLLIAAGATVKEVQDRLGHSDIQTTMNIYTHVSEKRKEETALKFAEFVGL